MKRYKVNEIFYSVQGEGRHAGEAAIFIRLSGCNLKCSFCDTQHNEGTMMTAEQIAKEVSKYDCALVVITGGEPTLQLDKALTDALHDAGKYLAMETNGTREIDGEIDWVTISPKRPFCGNVARLALRSCDELKVVYTNRETFESAPWLKFPSKLYYIQPCDTGNAEENARIIAEVVEYVKQNPEWKISLQTQKIINVR